MDLKESQQLNEKFVRIETQLENLAKNVNEGFARVDKSLGAQALTMEGLNKTIYTIADDTKKNEWEIAELKEHRKETDKILKENEKTRISNLAHVDNRIKTIEDFVTSFKAQTKLIWSIVSIVGLETLIQIISWLK